MLKTKTWIAVLFMSCICFSNFSSDVQAAQFISPSKKQLDVSPLTELKKAFGIRKIHLQNNNILEEITKAEKTGFIGYYGDSLDFMVYQDIIRHILEIIVEVPVKDDFHFLAVPGDPTQKIQSKEELALVFKEHTNPSIILYESTFPLNFSIWDNSNRLGLSTVEHFAKNEHVKPLGYKKRLKWLFNKLEIDEKNIDILFEAAHKKFNPGHSTGIILQIFDESESPYAFSKKVAYPAYPNGFIAENRTIDEYLLDEAFVPPYPHEIRLLLNNKDSLNPNNPLKIIRYVPNMSAEAFNSYNSTLKSKIKKLTYSKSAKKDYQELLLKAWN